MKAIAKIFFNTEVSNVLNRDHLKLALFVLVYAMSLVASWSIGGLFLWEISIVGIILCLLLVSRKRPLELKQ
jgi:hypothetical protein